MENRRRFCNTLEERQHRIHPLLMCDRAVTIHTFFTINYLRKANWGPT
jgi:hypothetical protein